MRRAAALLALLSTASAETCRFNKTADICPDMGQVCTEEVLCSTPNFCRARTVGTNSYTGICDVAPALEDVYTKTCTLGRDVPECVFNDPLRMSPKDAPSALQCVRAYVTDSAGTCRVGPNKHGDACNLDAECASGNCESQLRICRGVDEGEICTPGFPDPCGPGHFCAPTMGGQPPVCQKVVSAGRSCKYASACERGFFCAGPSLEDRKCIPLFSVPTGSNTTIGPYMCATGNAILMTSRAFQADSLYQCVEANSTLIGAPCDSKKPAPAGYECACSSDGSQFRLVTKGRLGLGARSKAFRDLFTCLNTATNVMGDLCEWDSLDLERVRYGSCGYYACYPQYLALVGSSGGRLFDQQFSQFIPYAECETTAAQAYYANVAAAPCVNLPNLENWKCAKPGGPTSLSLGGTWAVLILLLLGVIGAFWYHSYYFRVQNRTFAHPKMPWAAWWNKAIPA